MHLAPLLSRPSTSRGGPRRTMAGLTALAASAVLFTAGAPAVVAEPAPGGSGIGDDYFPLDGNGGIDVEHYDIDVEYDFESGVLTGTTTLDLTATRDLSSFNLDLLLDVDGVRVDGVPAAFDQPSDPARHELVITPAQPLDDGATAEVVVEYQDDPSQYAYLGERNWLADDDEYVTVNEPHMAPWWFASNDHPRDKATFDVRVTAEAGDAVVSNGELVGTEPAGDGRRTTHWRSTDPMATYLAFVAVGDFAVESGTTAGLPWTFAVSRPAARADAAQDARTWGERSARVTARLQDVLGPYPFDSTGGLVTSLGVGFALENQTRPIYPGLPGPSLLVHELAHQWFGDSVAVRAWKDIWLNEGFATYMQHHIIAARGGTSTRLWLQRAYRLYGPRSSLWRLDIADPCASGRQGCVSKIFDDAVYVRGAMALAALRNRIGVLPFRTLLRTWAAEREGGNGRVADFVDLAEDVADRPLDRFFRVWLSDTRRPRDTAANGL